MSKRDVNIILPLAAITYLSVLTASIVDGSFEIAAVVAWPHMILDLSPVSMWIIAEEGTSTMPTQASRLVMHTPRVQEPCSLKACSVGTML